ncbi:unnamed protein product [Closterium sp. Naga37s-1]|nr:unnamed protein product [Closterium sp. Naga37s-1]
MAGPWRAIVRLAAVLCALHMAAAQFEAPEFNIAVRKADIPLIKCDVCRKMAEQLDQQVEREREKAEPKKVSELKVIEVAEKLCDVKSANGGWITRLDIVESGDLLKLIEHEEDGECLSECKTIQRACQDIMGEHDTDIAERIFNDEPSQSSLQRHLCHDISKACSSKPPPVPQDREPGENWQKKDTSPPDYSKMAKEMNIPTSVMHDEAAIKDIKMPKGMGMPEEVFKRQQEKQAAGEAKAAAGGGKKKKGSKKGGSSSKEEQMGEVYAQAEEAAKGGKEEIVKFVEKMTGKKVEDKEPETETAGYDEL